MSTPIEAPVEQTIPQEAIQETSEHIENIPEPPAPVEEDKEPVMTVCQNPMYKKYFSMLKMVN